MEKIKNCLKLEIYNKGGQTWYCDYYFSNGINYEKGTTKASGYGYDKHSTATSNALNKFKFLYRFKKGMTKNNKPYGLYEDKSISYGIGISSVLSCLTAFSNVTIKSIHYGNRCDFIDLEITTTQKQLQKELEKNIKILNNKKSDKFDKKNARETINKIKIFFNMEV